MRASQMQGHADIFATPTPSTFWHCRPDEILAYVIVESVRLQFSRSVVVKVGRMEGLRGIIKRCLPFTTQEDRYELEKRLRKLQDDLRRSHFQLSAMGVPIV